MVIFDNKKTIEIFVFTSFFLNIFRMEQKVYKILDFLVVFGSYYCLNKQGLE